MRAAYMGGMEENFSRTIRASHIKEDTQTHVVLATLPERATLARLCGLEAIGLLRGEFVLRHESGGVIGGTLMMQARITQLCVVSLEPFEARLDETSQLRFVPERLMTGEAPEALDAESLEGPDEIPFTGDMIDLGAALAEQLALGLDPYPRKPGAELPAAAQDIPENPFALLKFRRNPAPD